MYSPSETDALILEAGAAGDITKLNDIRKRIGDDEVFRRTCDIVNDFCQGRRVLHYAAEMGKIEMCRFLIENVGVKIDVLTDRGDTPLLRAVKEGHGKIVEYLIDQGAQIGVCDSMGLTSLHHAVRIDKKEIIELLLMKGASVEADSVEGTPLQCAALHGNVVSVKLLLDHDAEANTLCSVSGSPLICAIKSHSLECMEMLLKAGADPNKFFYGLTPLARAAKEGETEFLKSLLKAGANPNMLSTGSLSPIEEAALAHNLEGVRILFPWTQMIPHFPNWTVYGIMEHCHSEEAKTKREQDVSSYLDVAGEKGKTAVSRKDYLCAVAWYSEGAYLDPSNVKWLLNRSLCFARLGRAAHALHDAEECVRMKPDCAKAHYRMGSAWKLFQNHLMSARAFETAWKLAPQDKEITAAFKGAMAESVSDSYQRNPEMSSLIQHYLL